MLYNIYHENGLGGRGGFTALEKSLVDKLVDAFLRGRNEIKFNGDTFSFGTHCFHIYEIPNEFGEDSKELIQSFDQYENERYRGNFQEEVFSDHCKDVTSEFLKGFEFGELVEYFNIYVNDSIKKRHITVLNRSEIDEFLTSWANGENPIWVDNRDIPFEKPQTIKIFDIKSEYLSPHRGDIKEFQRKIVRTIFKNEWTINALEYFGRDVSNSWDIKRYGSASKKRNEETIKRFDWSNIHPDILRVCRSRFVSPNYADAVEAAFKELNDIVKSEYKKSTGSEEDGTTLMRKAFTHTKPVFKFNDLSSESARNIQEGYMNIFAGVIIGIRNPKAHSNIQIDEQDAWEKIVLASHLMKMWDKRINENEKHIETS